MSIEVVVSVLPTCDICSKAPAEYDFRTNTGTWANGCPACWKKNRATRELGVGNGQRLVLAKAPVVETPAPVVAAVPAKKAKSKAPRTTASLSSAPTVDTRESWLTRAVPHLSLRIATLAGVAVPADLQVSVGFARGSKKAIGQCIDAGASVDKTTRNVSICPTLASASRVLDVLLHELIHAAVGCDHGHDKVFGAAARAVGLEGKLTATEASAALKADLESLATELGPYPHVAVVARPAIKQPKPGKSEWVRMYSKTIEGFLVNIKRDVIEEHGAPVDPAGDELILDKLW